MRSSRCGRFFLFPLFLAFSAIRPLVSLCGCSGGPFRPVGSCTPLIVVGDIWVRSVRRLVRLPRQLHYRRQSDDPHSPSRGMRSIRCDRSSSSMYPAVSFRPPGLFLSCVPPEIRFAPGGGFCDPLGVVVCVLALGVLAWPPGLPCLCGALCLPFPPFPFVYLILPLALRRGVYLVCIPHLAARYQTSGNCSRCA